MTLEDKHKEYELMETSPRRTIKIDTLKNTPLVYLNSWDYKSTLNDVSFKTTSVVPTTHPSVKVDFIDLHPVTNKKIYKITIQRGPKNIIKTILNRFNYGNYSSNH